MIVAGVLSGTSLDGIDVALVDLRPHARNVLAFATVPFEPALRERILAVYPPARFDGLTLAALAADTGAALGDAVRRVAGSHRPLLVGSHGVTIAHAGDLQHTLQIGDPFCIRERVDATVAYDFRAADCAAGGHGAPLVPYLDALLFADATRDRIALNLGGIANLTILRAGAALADTLAFDCGPGNLPLDTYVAARGVGNGRFDEDGALAARGSVDRALLAEWLADPYYAGDPPKSTGRERYGAPFIAAYRARLDALAVCDALATLVALTATTVATAIERFGPPGAQAIVSGGGMHNRALMAALRAALPSAAFVSTQQYGIDPDAKEAVLFAVLAYELVRGRPASVPNVTGARGARILGALAPHDLAGLSAALHVEAER